MHSCVSFSYFDFMNSLSNLLVPNQVGAYLRLRACIYIWVSVRACVCVCVCVCLCVCLCVCMCEYVHVSVYAYEVSKIVRLASQFATQNCLGCYSKLNLGCKFHSKVATHLPHIKLRTLYTLNIKL